MTLPEGSVTRDLDLAEDARLKKYPAFQVVYPHHGFGCSSQAIVSKQARGIDHTVTSLYMFGETGQRRPTRRECDVVGALTGELAAALERMRLPMASGEPTLCQVLQDTGAGYALLRDNGTILETNSRAFALATKYAECFDHRRPNRGMSEFVCSTFGEAWATAPYAQRFARGPQPGTVLELSLHRLRGRAHALAEDSTLVTLKEISMGVEPLSSARAGELSQRQRQLATLLVNTGLSGKEIADQMGISVGTLRKHSELLYRAMGAHSRAELVTMLRE